MKKGLLFALALGIGTFAIGQNMTKIGNNANPRQESQDVVLKSNEGLPIQTNRSNKAALTGVVLGKTNNIWTALVEQQSCLTYNEELGLFQFTHRAKVGEIYSGGTANSSGDIITAYSTNGGDSWSGILSYPNSSEGDNRYPGGIIYNPAGNTNPMNAYTAYVGPVHDGDSWTLAFMGSRKFDNTMESNKFMPSNGALIRMGFTSNSSDKIRVIGASMNYEPIFSIDTTYLLTGTFNASTSNFDWTMDKWAFDFIKMPTAGELASSFNTAWSKEGNIGYFWTTGSHASNNVHGYQPIVWKTINAGNDWAMMPIYDFINIPSLGDYLQPMKGTNISRPYFYTTDGVVDANDQLHLITDLRSAFSNNPDSLAYTHWLANNISNPIFDFHTTPSGWEAIHLGDRYSVTVSKKDAGFGGDLGWNARIQAGKTNDGTKIFASWTDSDTNNLSNDDYYFLNLLPDIYVVGIDIITGKQTNATNFSAGTKFSGDFFFHYMSDIVISDNGTYKIPMTKMDKGPTDLKAADIIFIKGIEFTEADFVTNPGFSQSLDNNVSISQNRPNPFTGNTVIDVNIVKAANISMNVINITGQTVYSVNLGRKSQGTHSIDFNASNLSSGIYFYTVNAGTSSVTKKMIVR